LRLVAACEVDRPGLALDRAGAVAVRAGVLGAEGLGLLLQEGIDGALDQAAGGLQGHFLQDAEVDVQAGAIRPESTPGDDFSPPGCQLAAGPEVFRAGMSAGHGLSSLALASVAPDELLFPFYCRVFFQAKQVLTCVAVNPAAASTMTVADFPSPTTTGAAGSLTVTLCL
jgi:hypothetical protein